MGSERAEGLKRFSRREIHENAIGVGEPHGASDSTKHGYPRSKIDGCNESGNKQRRVDD